MKKLIWPINEREDARWTRACSKLLLNIVSIVLAVASISCSETGNPGETNSTPRPSNAAIPPVAVSSESNSNRPDIPGIKSAVSLVRFTHNNQYHSQLACTVCHRRPNNASRISFPGGAGHSPCIGCHSQQFADNQSPMCTLCHMDADTGSMRGFPPLRSFGVRFDHSRHRKSECATCHKPGRIVASRTIPAGSDAHATCFQCHSSNARSSLSSCGVCHQPGGRPVTRSENAAIFAVFSHAKHKIACTTCHNIVAGPGRGKQVSAIAASMHLPSKRRMNCSTCHDNERAFGGDDFSDCKRCHTKNGFKF